MGIKTFDPSVFGHDGAKGITQTACQAEETPSHRAEIGIGENLVRLSVGVENARDIIRNIAQALERV